MHGAACTGLRWPPRLACPRHDKQMITCSLSPPRLFDGAPSWPSRPAMWATRGLLSHCAANGCKTRQPASQFGRQPKRTATYVAPRGRRLCCRSLGQAQRGCPHAAARCTAPRCGLITHREGSPRVQAPHGMGPVPLSVAAGACPRHNFAHHRAPWPRTHSAIPAEHLARAAPSPARLDPPTPRRTSADDPQRHPEATKAQRCQTRRRRGVLSGGKRAARRPPQQPSRNANPTLIGRQRPKPHARGPHGSWGRRREASGGLAGRLARSRRLHANHASASPLPWPLQPTHSQARHPCPGGCGTMRVRAPRLVSM